MSKISDIGRYLAHRHKMAVDEVVLTVDEKNYFNVEAVYDQQKKRVVLRPKQDFACAASPSDRPK